MSKNTDKSSQVNFYVYNPVSRSGGKEVRQLGGCGREELGVIQGLGGAMQWTELLREGKEMGQGQECHRGGTVLTEQFLVMPRSGCVT